MQTGERSVAAKRTNVVTRWQVCVWLCGCVRPCV